jgi:hypothetical protein
MCVPFPLPFSPFSQRLIIRKKNLTAATSTTPSGLLAILLASSGNFLLPIFLSAAQLSASRLWPDSDIPRDIERAKVVVNVAGAATTSLVAALKRWRHARKVITATAAEVIAAVEAGTMPTVAATERTALLAGLQARSSMRRAGEKKRVGFDAPMFDIHIKDDDQAQMALSFPVS